jgi:WD40 repeat protein
MNSYARAGAWGWLCRLRMPLAAACAASALLAQDRATRGQEAPPRDDQALVVKAILRGHTEAVESITFSPDSRLVATGSERGAVRVWRMAGGREELVLNARMDNQPARLLFCFSDDGSTLAAAADTGLAAVWDLTTGRETVPIREMFETPTSSLALGFPGNNPILIARVSRGQHGAPPSLRIWDLSVAPRKVPLESQVRAARTFKLSANGMILALGHPRGNAAVWDLSNGQQICEMDALQPGWVNFAFSFDGKFLATESGPVEGREVAIWDVQKGLKKIVFKDKLVEERMMDQLKVFGFSADDRTLITLGGIDKELTLWDIETGLRRRGRHSNRETKELGLVVLSPRGTRLTSTPWRDGKEVIIADWSTGETIARLRDQTLAAFSPDGRLIATAGVEFSVRLWTIANAGK